MERWRRFIRHLNPYFSLVLLAIPIAIVEPAKLIALVIFGKGHWLTGSFVMVCAYAGSLFVVDRLFKIVKPNLLRLRWFEATWRWFTAARARMGGWWRSRPAPGRRRG
jgi:hypothetical protein